MLWMFTLVRRRVLHDAGPVPRSCWSGVGPAWRGDPPKQLLGPPASITENSNGDGWPETSIVEAAGGASKPLGTAEHKARLTKGLVSDRTRRHEFLAGLVMCLVFAALSSSVLAEGAFEYKDPILTQNGIEYAITGVAETKEDPRWREFPLKLEFATVKHELYSNIDVVIYDEASEKVFAVKSHGPWLLVRLKAGSYTVHATDHQGVKKTLNTQVPATGQAEYTLKW